MPTNEILAPSYAIRTYKIATTPVPHEQRLYFNAVPTIDTVTGIASFPTYTDALHPSGWTIHDIFKEIDARAFADTSLIPAFATQKVELWQSVLGFPNVFMGFDGASYADVTGGGGTANAAAYTMWVFQSAQRDEFRLMWLDTQQASPQRTTLTNPPVADNGSLAWFMLRSPVKFVTNDNLPLKFSPSVNTGYNRKLARSYGRSIAP